MCNKRKIILLRFAAILSDTKNFITNNALAILIVLVVLSLVSQLISSVFSPSIQSIEPVYLLLQQTAQQYGELSPNTIANVINQLSEQEKSHLVALSANYLITVSLIFIVTSLLSTGSMLSLIFNLAYNQLTLSTLLQHFIRIAPQLLLFMLLCIPFIFALFMLAMLIASSFAMVLIIIGMFSYLLIYSLFLAVIIEPNTKPNTKNSMSHKLALVFTLIKQHFRLVWPMICCWFLANFVLSSAMSSLSLPNVYIINVLLDAINLFLGLIVVSYFYRLYTLTRTVTSNDASH